MGKCSDCNTDTLFDGLCVECSDKRFTEYPKLKAQITKLERIINQDLVGWASPKVLIDTIKREVLNID